MQVKQLSNQLDAVAFTNYLNIHYSNLIKKNTLNDLITALESKISTMKKFFNVNCHWKVPLYIFESKAELDDFNLDGGCNFTWSVGYCDRDQKIVAILNPDKVQHMSYAEMLKVVVHETVHYFNGFQDNFKNQIFSEGIACYIAEQGIMRGCYLNQQEDIHEHMASLILTKGDKLEEFAKHHGYFLGSNLICFMIDNFGEEKVIDFFSSSNLEETTPYKRLNITNNEFLDMWKTYLRIKLPTQS